MDDEYPARFFLWEYDLYACSGSDPSLAALVAFLPEICSNDLRVLWCVMGSVVLAILSTLDANLRSNGLLVPTRWNYVSGSDDGFHVVFGIANSHHFYQSSTPMASYPCPLAAHP